MTADVVAEVNERCMDIGMNEFITKPISPESVVEAVIKWIKPGKRDLSSLKKKDDDIVTNMIEIPDLNGINITEGLSRVNENKKLYQNLLFKFHDNNINLIEHIRNAYKAGNEELTLRLVHTLKGVSGNIGASDLHIATKELERKLKEKDYTDLNEIIDDYAQSLNPVLDSIAEYRNSQSSVNQLANIDDDGADLNKELFTKLCDRLTSSLEDNDMEAIAIVEEVLRLSGLGDYRKQFNDIENLVKNYDFDGALDVLNRT
jgi:two-component system sensor histidine kinase/response regulator